jgi:predicted AAA+ superfamily ATPase
MLKRQTYLNWLISSKDNEFIKVITGVRRSGKSVILRLYQDYLLEQGVLAENIIFYNFEHPDNFGLNSFEKLYADIQQKASLLSSKIYFIFDEIQEVKAWQKLVNGLRVAYDADIYITGSNANLLSGELATYLAGRYMEMTVYPLSFAEFVAFSRELGITKHDELLFQEYLKWGGFPNLPSIDNEQIKRDILKGIYSSIVLKDVASRGAIREVAMLERVIAYLLDIIGQSVSVKKIADTLTSAGTKSNSTSIDSYIQLLKESFIFYEASRYDIRGKSRLKTGAKYYVVDTGLRNTVLGQVGNLGSQLENIIFMELKRRGYEVFVGKLDSEEIDFVCFRGEEKEYFQVAYQLPVDSDREQRNLLHITDNYKKSIITLNRMDVGVIEGIQVVHAVDWLLNKAY